MEVQCVVSGPLGYVVNRLREIRQQQAEEELVVAERTVWMGMLERDINNGGGWDE